MKRVRVVYLLLIFLLSACSFAPKCPTPNFKLPKAKKTSLNTNLKLTNWWKGFNDKKLDDLIDFSLKNNDNLLIAYEKINEARAKYSLFSSSLYPSINAQVGATKTKSSGEMGYGDGEIVNDFKLLGNLSYNLDLFGKIRNQKKAQLELLLAQKSYADAVKINLISEVAITYFKICAINKEIKIANKIVKDSLALYNYKRLKYKNGLIDELSLRRDKIDIDLSKLDVEEIKKRKNILENRLSLLLGKEPRDIFNAQYNSTKLPRPLKIPPFLPSKIIEKRPDIIEAQRQLKAANLEVGVAKAAYFPDIYLTGILGFESQELANLFRSSAGFWQIGAGASVPIFDFGRIKANIKIATSRQRQALFSYIFTVKNAFKEIHEIMGNLSSIKRQIKIQKNQVKNYRNILHITRKQYQNGLVDYAKVIYAKKDYESSLINLIDLKAAYLGQEVLLYKALGGGW